MISGLLLQLPSGNGTLERQVCEETILASQVYVTCNGVAGLELDLQAKVEACATDLQVRCLSRTLAGLEVCV